MRWSYCITTFLAAWLIGVSDVRSEQVLFSEIMVHPAGTRPEYIELCNNTATPFDIAEWQLSGGVDYVFPTFSFDEADLTFLMPYERIILSSVDEATLRSAYNVADAARVYGPWTGNLKNAGERITLKDKNGAVVCTVRYDGQWFPAADGAGHSLVLKNPDKPIDDWRNWTFSRRLGGTPGSEEVQETETPMANPQVNLLTGIPFVNYEDVWKFNDKNVDLGTGWREPDFDDSAWAQGPGLFGFETAALPAPGIRTSFTNSQQLTYYLRTKFVYHGSLKGVTITVDQVLDDGAVYTLNGQEIGRSGMPAGAVSFTTVSGRTVSDAVEELGVITTGGSALVNGTNVLAVEVHQTNTSSSDVVFGMRLSISAPTEPSLVINEVLPGPAGVGFVEIYNPGASAIALLGHYFTDDPANLKKSQVTTDGVVAAGGLASVGFVESGLAVKSPLKVYLVAPDGGTVINAISTTLPLDGRSIGRKPTGSDAWFLFTEPTPNAPNASQSSLAAVIHLSEVHFGPSKTVDWVEFYNSSDETIGLAGLFLSSKADLSDKVALGGSVQARGYASGDFAFPVSGGQVTLFVVNAEDTVLSARTFERPVLGDCLQAFPAGSDEWYASTVSTRDAANNPARNTDIVINEIMVDPPSNEPSGEFIELYNRGSIAVDVSGWRFADGIDLTIPAGTTIPAAGYLVVAADAAWLWATYGGIAVVGDFTDQLSNQGELIRLVDQWGNLADEVDYLPGGNWPNRSHGDGSSMELRDPWMDNSLASAWLDSDESNKTSFEHYRYSDVYRQLTAMGAPTDYKELHFYLVGDSHVVLKNIQVRENGTGPNLIVNGNKMSTDGRSASGWLAQGSHHASFMEGDAFHIVSDGHGDNRANRVEIDVTGMQTNRTYEISFDARWVLGASRLIVETWDHSIATSILLPVPADLGTPGTENTCFNPLSAPQLDGLMHFPAVPAPGQAVKVTVHVLSRTLLPKVLLFHRLDNRDGNGAWDSKPMADDGVTGGDERAGDGIYTATLTEYGQNGQVVQFYGMAFLLNGETGQLPREGDARAAMYVVDTPTAPGDLRRMRFVVSALDLRDMAEGDSATGPYGYKFPRLSNHYFNATLIIHEKDVVYGCEIRCNGSPWTRGGNLLNRGKFKLPKDNLFRGNESLLYRYYDVGWVSHDRLVRYWLYLLGNPVNENEFIQVEVNNGGTAVREEVEPYGNHLLDRVYENGSQGELYKIDDEWWFQDDWNRTSRNADWSYKGTDNAGRYRSEWMKRNRENEDDYSALISFFKKVYVGPYTQAEIDRLIDPVASMKACAVLGYIHAWDFFSLDRGKNSYFYRRSTDGRFMFLPWDCKRSFDNPGASFYNGMPGFREYLVKPYNFRLFKHYLARMLENYTIDSLRVYVWLQAEREFASASGLYRFDFPYESWFANRQQPGFNLLGQSRTVAFNITTNAGNPITTGVNTLSLSGVSPLRVFKVEVAGHPEAQFTWDNESVWTLAGIVLRTGANALTVNGVDEFGAILHHDMITVNKTGNAPPVMAMKANPGSWQVSLLEQLTLDASGSGDPDGTPLNYAWSVTPSDASLDASAQEVATAIFSHPGLYSFTATGQDAGGGSATIQREVAVYGPQGLSVFNPPRLEPFWSLENVALRSNYTTGPSYSLTELSGYLVMQVWNDGMYPLDTQSPTYPLIWRPLPSSTEWAFLSSLELRGQVFGDYATGIMVETAAAGSPVRYAFGIEDGSSLTVRRITASGTMSVLKTVTWNISQADLRIHRTGNTLSFEQRMNGVWTSVHGVTMPVGSVAAKAALFIATDTPQSVEVAFNDALLVDWSSSE